MALSYLILELLFNTLPDRTQGVVFLAPLLSIKLRSTNGLLGLMNIGSQECIKHAYHSSAWAAKTQKDLLKVSNNQRKQLKLLTHTLRAKTGLLDPKFQLLISSSVAAWSSLSRPSLMLDLEKPCQTSLHGLRDSLNLKTFKRDSVLSSHALKP